MWRRWWWWSESRSVPVLQTEATATASGSPFLLEHRLCRVTTSDIARVTPSDVERVKCQMGPYDLQRAMEVLLDDNRYAEVIASASPLSLQKAAKDLTAAECNTLSVIAKSNLLALYNLLPHVTRGALGSGECVI